MDVPTVIQVCSAYRLMFLNESGRLNKISKSLSILSALLGAFTATAIFSDASTSGHTAMQYIVGTCSALGVGLGTIPEILKIPSRISKYSTGFATSTKLIQELRELDIESGIPKELMDRFGDLEGQAFNLPEHCYHAIGDYLGKHGMTELG